MDARNETPTVGNFLEQTMELGALLRIEPLGDRGIVFERERADRLDDAGSRPREVERVGPSIFGDVAAFDEAALLEIVEQGDEATGEDGEVRAEGLLARPGPPPDREEDARVRRQKLEGPEELTELGGGEGADLREQER